MFSFGPPTGPAVEPDGSSISPPAGGETTTTAISSAFTSAPSPTGPPLDSFFLRSLRHKCNPDVAPTDDNLGPQWDEQVRRFVYRVNENANFSKYSCTYRCGAEQRNASVGLSSDLPRCYCDDLCDDFGDCCFDFDALCRKRICLQAGALRLNATCFALKNGKLRPEYTGYAVWNKCPQKWTEESVRQKCQEEDQSGFLRNLPVFDKESLVTYKNVFCAKCNGAVNTTYWKLKFVCQRWFNLTDVDLGKSVALLFQNCWFDKKPERHQLNYLKRCIPRFQDCRSISQERNESYCQTECLRYAFPVCISHYQTRRFRNPQCALCSGFEPNDLKSECITGDPVESPPLTIFFDFSSTSKYSVVVEDDKENVVKTTTKELSCSLDEVYDPYAGSCKAIVSTEPGTSVNGKENKTGEVAGNRTGLLPNCTFIAFNKTDYVQQSNGSIYLKLHNKIYSNTTYKIIDDRLLLCVNFTRSRNVSRTENKFGKHKITKTPVSLQLLSLIGCIVSMVSLVLLLITYILFAELRNLPGKVIINLALSLLLYQSVFFSAVKTDDQDTCLAVAVLLHFFVLSSFTWMNVMAYDVHRTFTNTSEGVVAHRQNRQGGYTKRLVKYCLYAWGSPVLLVLVCVITDHVKKGSIGYGEGEEECFISQPQAILYSFVLPVALLLIFNLFALGHTVFHIVKTRKRTQQQKNRQHGSSVAVICVKMASVMGVTWILGIAANLKALSFLWYPYVVLNSLQGLFIFLSFAASGKALELYKSKLAGILRNRTASAQSEEDNTRNHYCNHTAENEYLRETQL
ncbi:hypothetical protein ACROYT_G023676 [Oculina patagonica]